MMQTSDAALGLYAVGWHASLVFSSWVGSQDLDVDMYPFWGPHLVYILCFLDFVFKSLTTLLLHFCSGIRFWIGLTLSIIDFVLPFG